MVKKSAEPFVPKTTSFKTLSSAVQNCRGCDLYKNATRGVFGEGSKTATIIFVGEQPGNAEDLQGHPFVGPSGKLLDEALQAAGIARDQVYITNSVKHFKFERKGKLRIHKKPSVTETNACKPWLVAEINFLKPEIIVCLGATASQTVFGKAVRIKDLRSKMSASPLSPKTFVTVHPASVLRAQDPASMEMAKKEFFQDIKKVAKFLGVK